MPFVACVEEQRGKIGRHLSLPFLSTNDGYGAVSSLIPGMSTALLAAFQKLDHEIASSGHRVIVAGHGGDELLGGLPSGLPELGDHLFRGSFCSLLERGVAWCLPSRKPVIHMLHETVQLMVDVYLNRNASDTRFIPGGTRMLSKLSKRNDRRTDFTRSRAVIPPSRLLNARGWWHSLETLPHRNQGLQMCREYRFPILDRDLVEFLFRVPRQHLLQPRRRRAMMRSAMRGIVPDDVIERPRKGYRQSSVLKIFSSGRERLIKVLLDCHVVKDGMIDRKLLLEAVDSLSREETTFLAPVLRIVLFEMWI